MVEAGVSATPTPPSVGDRPGREEMTAAITAVHNDPANFAGAYIDVSGYPLHINYVGDDHASRARVEALIPSGLEVAWHAVPHSYSELSRIQAEIVDGWKRSGLELIGAVSVDVIANRVVVSTPEHEPDLEARLLERHDQAVAFKIEPEGVAPICLFPDTEDLPACQ